MHWRISSPSSLFYCLGWPRGKTNMQVDTTIWAGKNGLKLVSQVSQEICVWLFRPPPIPIGFLWVLESPSSANRWIFKSPWNSKNLQPNTSSKKKLPLFSFDKVNPNDFTSKLFWKKQHPKRVVGRLDLPAPPRLLAHHHAGMTWNIFRRSANP